VGVSAVGVRLSLDEIDVVENVMLLKAAPVRGDYRRRRETTGSCWR